LREREQEKKRGRRERKEVKVGDKGF